MSRQEEYYANFGKWRIEEYVADRILNNPQEMDRFGAVLKNIPPDVSTFLDIGCGPGVFLHLVDKHLGIKGVGIEITDSKIHFAQRTLNVQAIKGDVSSLSFHDHSFDMVTALEVIEHLPYGTYERALKEIERVAKKWIIITVPCREERRYVKCPYCGVQFDPNYHMRSFNDGKMQHLFPAFEIVTLEKASPYRKTPYLLKNVLALVHEQPFPEFAVCPACGFRREACTGTRQTRIVAAPLQKWARSISTLLPRRKHYRWIIAVYRRMAR